MQYTIYNAFWNFHFLRSTYVWQKQFRGGWKMHFNHLFIHFAVALFHRHCFHPSYFVNHAGVENVGSLPYTSFSINSNSFQCFFPLKMASNLWAESKHFPRWNGAPLVLGNWMSALILGSIKERGWQVHLGLQYNLRKSWQSGTLMRISYILNTAQQVHKSNRNNKYNKFVPLNKFFYVFPRTACHYIEWCKPG